MGRQRGLLANSIDDYKITYMHTTSMGVTPLEQQCMVDSAMASYIAHSDVSFPSDKQAYAYASLHGSSAGTTGQERLRDVTRPQAHRDCCLLLWLATQAPPASPTGFRVTMYLCP